jgi:hypothetical protein
LISDHPRGFLKFRYEEQFILNMDNLANQLKAPVPLLLYLFSVSLFNLFDLVNEISSEEAGGWRQKVRGMRYDILI